ncbi:MAG: 3TM-type holin [Thalassolituus sp.]|jgi:hypothetical protein
MNLLGIGSLLKSIGAIADDLTTSDEERLKIALKDKQIDAGLVMGQLDINKTEAQHKSVFVAGWRPAIGWVGAFALAYQFIVYPLLMWGWAWLQASGVVPDGVTPPPVLPTDALWVIVSGMLGIGSMRSFDKAKGNSTERFK